MKKGITALFISGSLVFSAGCGIMNQNEGPQDKPTEDFLEIDEFAQVDVEEGNIFSIIHVETVQEILDFLKEEYNFQQTEFDRERWELSVEELETYVQEQQVKMEEEKVITRVKEIFKKFELITEELKTNLGTEELDDVMVGSTFNEIQILIDEAKEQGAVEVTEELKTEAKTVIQLNVDYGTNGDLDGYMSTLASHYQTEDIRNSNQHLFEMYEITYELTDFQLLEAYEGAVVVRVNQNTTFSKVPAGYTAQNSKAELRHTLIKEDGLYKIYSTEIINQEFDDEIIGEVIPAG